jgi:hypothetical protein
LQIECDFSDEFLVGHARRVGLLGEQTSQETVDRLLPTIRSDVYYEMDRIRDANFPHFYRISETDPVEINAKPLQEFLDISAEQATQLAATAHLFSD